MYSTLIEKGLIYESQAARSIRNFYRTVFIRTWEIQKTDEHDYPLPLEMNDGVQLAKKMGDKLLEVMTAEQYMGLFFTDPQKRRYDVLETLVEIVYEALSAISKGFKGFDDPLWQIAITSLQQAFPSVGEQPDGMTPF